MNGSDRGKQRDGRARTRTQRKSRGIVDGGIGWERARGGVWRMLKAWGASKEGRRGQGCVATWLEGPGSLGREAMIRMESKDPQQNHFLCSGYWGRLMLGWVAQTLRLALTIFRAKRWPSGPVCTYMGVVARLLTPVQSSLCQGQTALPVSAQGLRGTFQALCSPLWAVIFFDSVVLVPSEWDFCFHSEGHC